MKLAIVMVSILALLGVGWLVYDRQSASTPPANIQGFSQQKKSPHFETSTPAHGTTMPAAPINVVVDTNFDLSTKSEIYIKRNGAGEMAFHQGPTTVDENKLAMRRRFSSTLSPDDWDGMYTVEYSACWPDGSCHDGQFQFKIDRSLLDGYSDWRGQPEVSVRMSQIKFTPINIRINPGTKVTWVNDDQVDHYVNTDSHPAHTYFPGQNSNVLGQGASYAQTFTQRGAYPYHCSAHTEMLGMIVVG